MNSTPYEQGAKAYRPGEPITDNPYIPGEPKALSWANGWRRAQFEEQAG